jgi:hypothetical protein
VTHKRPRESSPVFPEKRARFSIPSTDSTPTYVSACRSLPNLQGICSFCFNSAILSILHISETLYTNETESKEAANSLVALAQESPSVRSYDFIRSLNNASNLDIQSSNDARRAARHAKIFLRKL